MGRGLGQVQRDIIDTIEHGFWYCWSVRQLAEAVGRSEPQVRRAVAALERRGLLVVERGCIGWKGDGEYGRVLSDGSREGVPLIGLVIWTPRLREKWEHERRGPWPPLRGMTRR